MSVHRFRELFETTEPVLEPRGAGSFAAFVPCPSPVALGMSAFQVAQTEYLYRLAFEQAQAQLIQAPSSRWPAFSLN
jgi:hypothetical protein